jgi:signal transduction histidine kinase
MGLPSSLASQTLRHALADRLHDTVCQYASALNTEAYMIGEARWRDLDDHVQRLQLLTERLSDELRQLVNELRRTPADEERPQDYAS